MAKENDIPKAYDASRVEDGIYARWEKSGLFNPDNLPDGKQKDPFTIVLPPPNATGTLHVGHAVMLAIQDLLIRYKRMRGYASLWIPGTDHAAIATQTKVEKLLKEEGKTRHDLGREAFRKRVDAFVASSQDTIRNQMRKMGSSCDWSREAFTLDDQRSHAVRVMFKKMYDDGLVYRGDRVVNWCTRCTSTLADDEVEYKDQTAKLYYLKYGPFLVATTRPETKLADTAVAVHPDDERYKDKVGTSFEVNWGEGTKPLTIHVIADREIDPEFGTGVLGVTPAHSAVDFRMAAENDLPVMKLINEEGKITDMGGKYEGMGVGEAREAFVADLEKQGLIEKIEDIPNRLSVCYRCETPIEPLTSLQWFVSVNAKIPKTGHTLKQLATEAVGSEKITIVPERFKKVYFHWMDNLRDWCISRQLWYGHRIPVWYCDCGQTIVEIEDPEKCTKCGKSDLRQDEDTLDTWFSSGMWTFSTLGWPEQSDDLKRFHPTQVLETGYDILFFWVARMILMTTYAMEQIPFETVYLHGLVRDEQGRKMSKSLGNIIDPLDVSAKYGTDAVRLSLIIGMAPGNDSKIWDEKIAGFRNFTNKLWNISRFVMMSVEHVHRVEHQPEAKTLADRWILSRLAEVVHKVTNQIERYEFSPAGETLRDFTWGEFADWYLEIAKIQLASEGDKETTEEVLLYVLETLLKLWHPYMPFVTEAVWGHLVGNKEGENFLMIQEWPMLKPFGTDDEEARRQFADVQQVIGAIRNLRSEYKVEPAKFVKAVLIAGDKAEIFEREGEVLRRLARLEELEIHTNAEKPEGSASVVVAGVEVCLPLEGLVDTEKERARLGAEKENVVKYIASLETKLGNKGYVDKAPPQVVEETRQKLKEKKEELKKIESHLENL